MPNRLIRALFIVAALAAAPALASPAFAGKPETYTKWGQNLAMNGYDPVSFFANAPAKGAAEFAVTYKGAEYRFANAANLARFKADPAAYAPQYGGYCAWALAQNKLAPGDPRYWRIVAGKLYLNYNADIQKKWEKDIPGFIAEADANWPSVLDK